ncbi:MAG: hypothetical protein WCG80_16945 [Spirochaetales bacterium]
MSKHRLITEALWAELVADSEGSAPALHRLLIECPEAKQLGREELAEIFRRSEKMYWTSGMLMEAILDRLKGVNHG